jgi:hypothetical protein
MQEPVSDGSADLDQLRAELLRLKIKRSETEDLDIRKALEERITMLATQIATLKAAAPPEEIEIPIEPATPEQIAQADQLIREARVQKMRKNLQASTDLLKKASEIAPGAPAVLEALGDDLMERRRLNEAAKAYKQAVRFDPTNVGLERKYAMAVMGMSHAGSIEEQLRANLSGDGPSDSMVSPKAAMILNLFVPGLGQVVLGRPVGYALIAVWVVCLVWVNFRIQDVYLLMGTVSGSTKTPNLTVLIPLFIMAVIFIGSIASLGTSRGPRRPKRIDHPTPPVNLPYD